MTKIDELLEELAQEAGATRRVLERVPEERLEWAPHEKSMTLGQLAMHVATLPGAIAGIAMQPAFDVRTAVPRPGAGSAGELLAALEESLFRVRSLLGAMDDDALRSPWRLMEGERELLAIDRGAVLRSVLFNHWYHHRGQLTVYLRLSGVPVPAIYGDSADETPFPAGEAGAGKGGS